MRYDAAFANAKHIPGGEGYPSRWAAAAAAFRTAAGARAELGQRYGPAAAGWFDLFRPPDDPDASGPRGLLVFVHGGYWLAFGPRDFSHLAAGALARGWAVAMPAYTLAPAARIATMTQEVAAALVRAAALVDGPLVIAGHSAGGHLALRMASADVALPASLLARLRRIVAISPLSDLRPLRETSMQADLALTPEEARAESPALVARRAGTEVRVWVGAGERPVFLDQARRLGNAWACPVTVEPARHHFDVIEGLERESPLLRALLD